MLSYHKVRFDQKEWDNVAPIVPRFLMYLEKYVEGLSEKCSDFDEREHIDHLRVEMLKKMYDTNEKIGENRDSDLIEKAAINDEKIEINKRIKRFKKEFELFKSKASALDQNDC